MTLFLTRDAGLTGSEAGLIVSGYGAGVVLSAFGGGVCADLIGRKKTLVGSLTLSALVMVVIPSFDTPVVIAGLLFVFGLVNGAAQPAIATLITDLVPPQHRRAAFAYKYWAVNLGYAIGPLLAGFIADQEFEYLFYAQAGVLVISAWIVVGRVPETLSATSPRAEDGAEPEVTIRISDVLRDRVFITFVIAMFGYSVVYVQSTVALPLAMVHAGFSTQEYGYLLTLNGALWLACAGLCLLIVGSLTAMAGRREKRVREVIDDEIPRPVDQLLSSRGERGLCPASDTILPLLCRTSSEVLQ